MSERPDAPAASGDEPYVISDDRLIEIRSLLAPPWEQTASEVVPKVGVTVYQLAAAVEDLLAERDDRRAGPTVTGSSYRADDPGQMWVRMSMADYEALCG